MTGSKLFTLEYCQKAPNWTGFCKRQSLKVSAPTIIGNCCTIPASPTGLNVVYAMMLYVMKILSNLGEPYPCSTVNNTIYQFGEQIQWHVSPLQDITLRLQGLNRLNNFIDVIGKRLNSMERGYTQQIQWITLE